MYIFSLKLNSVLCMSPKPLAYFLGNGHRLGHFLMQQVWNMCIRDRSSCVGLPERLSLA